MGQPTGEMPTRVTYPLTDIVADDRFLETDWLLEKWTPSFLGFKRAIDLLACLPLMLLAVVSFPLIAVAIKLDSRGPVIYRQTRVGKNGVEFSVLKYRSMVVDAEANGARFASKSDSRITRVGLMLRKSRLDELPQVLNVLRGHMSVVGPRPERPHVIDEMSIGLPQFRMRTVVRPGLTGWAQVKGAYAANESELAEKLEYDLFYIRNASVLLDCRTLLATIGVVVNRKGI